MNISDEKLSAFLDAELPESEMEVIREHIILDENIANRLAELAMVDEVVAATYSKIDERPLPNAVTALFAEDSQANLETNSRNEEPKTAKVIAFPLLQSFQYGLQKHLAIAASVVMVLGLGAIQVLHKNNTEGSWQDVAKILDTAPSGIVQSAANGVEVKPRLTFINKHDEYCRQFDMSDKKTATENIACRKDDGWKIAVSVTLDKSQEVNTYQTASGGSLLDAAVEDMVKGEFFDAQTESEAIEQGWLRK